MINDFRIWFFFIINSSRLLLLLVNPCFAEERSEAVVRPPLTQESLKRYLQIFDSDKSTRYIAAFRQLGDDKKTEAIVYLIGKKWCGSGGCNTLILTQDDSSWRLVTNITITRPPIRVLKSTFNGWHSIGIWVQGGGTQQGYEAVLQYNGKTYPKNPTIFPSRKLKVQLDGDVIVSTTQASVALYDNSDN